MASHNNVCQTKRFHQFFLFAEGKLSLAKLRTAMAGWGSGRSFGHIYFIYFATFVSRDTCGNKVISNHCSKKYCQVPAHGGTLRSSDTTEL